MNLKDNRKVEFFICENAIIDREDLNIYEKIVYLTLCRYSNNDNSCFPSYQTISKKANISRIQVIRTIKTLIEKNLIFKQSRPEKSNIYYVNSAKIPSISQIPPSVSQIPGVVSVRYPKNTNNKNTNYKNFDQREYDSEHYLEFISNKL